MHCPLCKSGKVSGPAFIDGGERWRCRSETCGHRWEVTEGSDNGGPPTETTTEEPPATHPGIACPHCGQTIYLSNGN